MMGNNLAGEFKTTRKCLKAEESFPKGWVAFWFKNEARRMIQPGQDHLLASVEKGFHPTLLLEILSIKL